MERCKESLQLRGICNKCISLWQRGYIFKKDASWKDLLWGGASAVFFAFFFYRSIWGLGITIFAGMCFIYWRLRRNRRLRIQRYLEQFKECILSVLGSLKAGYAVENAFLESIPDMEVMYGKTCWIAEELRSIRRGLQNNKTMEKLLEELGEKSNLLEIIEFAEVFVIAKRNSGNIPGTIELYCKIISERLELTAELETLLVAKRLEQKVMSVMPFLIVLYLGYTNPGYFDMMYHNLTGIGVMTGCLIVYMVAYGLAEVIFEKSFG